MSSSGGLEKAGSDKQSGATKSLSAAPSKPVKELNIIGTLKWWAASEPNVITIPVEDKCDYCKGDMRYAGANYSYHVVRSCQKHLKRAERALSQERGKL